MFTAPCCCGVMPIVLFAIVVCRVDKSPINNSFRQAVSGSQPHVSVDSGGYPTVNFTTGTSMTNTYGQIGSGGRTSFAVMRDINTTDGADHPIVLSGTTVMRT